MLKPLFINTLAVRPIFFGIEFSNKILTLLKSIKMTNLIGKKIIARIDRAGVFHGTLAAKDAEITTMTDVRRIYYWKGALSVTDMSVTGVKAGSKITLPAKRVEFETGRIVELIECTDEASKSIESIKPWKA